MIEYPKDYYSWCSLFEKLVIFKKVNEVKISYANKYVEIC